MDNNEKEVIYKTASIGLFVLAVVTFLFRNVLAAFLTYGNVTNIYWGILFLIMMGFLFLILHILEKTRLTNKAMMEKILEAIENKNKEDAEEYSATVTEETVTENSDTTDEETKTSSTVNFTMNTTSSSSTDSSTTQTSSASEEETKAAKNDPFFASRIKEINL